MSTARERAYRQISALIHTARRNIIEHPVNDLNLSRNADIIQYYHNFRVEILKGLQFFATNFDTALPTENESVISQVELERLENDKRIMGYLLAKGTISSEVYNNAYDAVIRNDEYPVT